jgi:hypothetical protein
MGRLERLSTGAVLLLLLFGCKDKGPRQLKDTEGRTFLATCTPQGECKLEQRSGPKNADKPEQKLTQDGRLVGICDVGKDQPVQGPFDCRSLSCEKDQDCPPAHGMKDGQCLNRRCSDPAQDIAVQDAIMLCLSGTGLGRESPRQIERYALALNCGSPCRVPAPCPQP